MNEEKCSQCGTPAAPGAKFCESCSASLAAVPQSVEALTIEKEIPTNGVLGADMQYQGVGIRLVAFLVDTVILWIISSILAYPFAAPAFSYDVSTGAFMTGNAFYVIAGVIFAILWVLYSTLLLGRYGQTVGKILVKIKVVNEDKSSISYGDAFVRTILSVLDAIPFVIPYLLGAIFIWTSEKRQRLGDRVAHTIVVKT